MYQNLVQIWYLPVPEGEVPNFTLGAVQIDVIFNHTIFFNTIKKMFTFSLCHTLKIINI